MKISPKTKPAALPSRKSLVIPDLTMLYGLTGHTLKGQTITAFALADNVLTFTLAVGDPIAVTAPTIVQLTEGPTSGDVKSVVYIMKGDGETRDRFAVVFADRTSATFAWTGALVSTTPAVSVPASATKKVKAKS